MSWVTSASFATLPEQVSSSSITRPGVVMMGHYMMYSMSVNFYVVALGPNSFITSLVGCICHIQDRES